MDGEPGIRIEDGPTVIGKMNPEEIIRKLQELGEHDLAGDLQHRMRLGEEALGPQNLWPFLDRPWEHTEHVFGYVPTNELSQDWAAISHAGSIQADQTLRNKRLRVSLDRLRVAAYPGMGRMHTVLFDFYAQNQLPTQAENLHFSCVFRGCEEEHVAVIGYPIFVGLNVGTEGLSFRCLTVNVRNEADEALLGFLESDVFKRGLRLVTTVQPVIAPFSEMATGLVKGIAARSRNVAVQEFFMGLDFSSVSTRARLRTGSYLAVQVPNRGSNPWSWGDWIYSHHEGLIVKRVDYSQTIPYNYVCFGISEFSE